MKATFPIICTVIIAMIFSCDSVEITSPDGTLSEDSLLTLTQYRTFQYFWDGAEENSKLARERIHLDEPEVDQHVVTIGGTGFGLMAIVVGMDRGFVTREEGVQRLSHMIRFLAESDRFHGVWPHWLDGTTGKVKPFSPKDDGGDLVETSFLAVGLITVRQYLSENENERALALLIDELLDGIEWNWYTRGENVLYWHWSPNHDWEMNFAIDGYNECLITYLMAASGPQHAIEPEVYHKGWAENGEIVSTDSAYNLPLVLRHNYAEEYGGPLFWAHYSYLGLNPQGLSDRYANYWDLNKNHALINYAWCRDNPKGHQGYEQAWGLTSSYSVNFYHGHKPGEDDLGVISPTAALASFPYTPTQSMEALRYFHDDLGDRLLGPYGFYDAYSKSENWFPPRYLAIDQGPIVVMIENYRTGLLWDLFMSAPEVQQGLKRLDFTSTSR